MQCINEMVHCRLRRAGRAAPKLRDGRIDVYISSIPIGAERLNWVVCRILFARSDKEIRC